MVRRTEAGRARRREDGVGEVVVGDAVGVVAGD